jgi:peptide/nickel transport system substrate-binding protein
MNRNIIKISLLLILPFVFTFCDSKTPKQNNRIVIGISADVQTFNPLFTISVDEGAITELLYLGLFDFRWNEDDGAIDAHPMLAEKWEWADDSSYIKIYLRDDAFWSDGKKITVNDVIFSFDAYSDPLVQSRLYGTFKNLFADEENHIDVKETFEIISPFEFKVKFPSNSVPNLDVISLPIIPTHIFKDIKRDELSNSEYNFKPVSSGSYYLKKWDKNQTITLAANKNSFLYNNAQINEIVFKVVPDYSSKILQLQKGEIDLLELVKVDDIEEIESNGDLKIVPVIGREYDYVGLNNIDPKAYSDREIFPNKLFGSKNVRKAISYAINRKEILNEYLLGYGELAATPVSSIFKVEFNDDVSPYDFNLTKAKSLLASEGWIDFDQDGILEKGNDKFSFTLYYPSGIPLREFASMVVRNNLKAVGVDVKLEIVELGTLIDYLFEKKIDAWMLGWYVPIPVELKPYWYSEFDSTPLNFASYRNVKVDSLLDLLQTKISVAKRIETIKEFQKIVHDDEPVSFLYWIPNICVYNKRIAEINITPLGTVNHCWEWRLK